MNQEPQRRLLRQYISNISPFVNPLWNHLKSCWLLQIILLYITLTIYLYYNDFPHHLRHIEPAQWKSHSSPLLDQHLRDLADVKPRILNDTLMSLCEDLQLNSKHYLYCINQKRQIIMLNTKTTVSQKLFTLQNGNSYGLRLSKNQEYLYFVNSEIGLCEFDIKKKKVRSLVSEYQGKFLISLSGVEIHPQNPDLIYVTQSSKLVSMDRFSVDIFLANPFGRVFQFNKQKQKLSLVADQLHFPKGIAFHKYKNQDTLLISQTSRFRVSRIYLEETKKGKKQVAINRLDIYPNNIKVNEEGQFLIGAMGIKYPNWKFLSESKWMRLVYSRVPTGQYSSWVGTYEFGGVRVKIDEKDEKHKIEHLLWNHFKNYQIVSTMLQRDGHLFISSFKDRGVIMIEDVKEKLMSTSKHKVNRNNGKYALTANEAGYYEGREEDWWSMLREWVEEADD